MMRRQKSRKAYYRHGRGNVNKTQPIKYKRKYRTSGLLFLPLSFVERGGAVVEALSYKPEGHEIDSRWCHWNYSLT
jgi:hypothetical protein